MNKTLLELPVGIHKPQNNRQCFSKLGRAIKNDQYIFTMYYFLTAYSCEDMNGMMSDMCLLSDSQKACSSSNSWKCSSLSRRAAAQRNAVTVYSLVVRSHLLDWILIDWLIDWESLYPTGYSSRHPVNMYTRTSQTHNTVNQFVNQSEQCCW